MLLIKPTLSCNKACRYCYETPWRSKNEPEPHNLEAVLKKIAETDSKDICLHGGEPLILPLQDVEKLLEAAFLKTGRSSIQTNGTLITEDLITIFKRFKTSVGISIDGDQDLNEFRMNLEETSRLLDTMNTLTKEGLTLSVIIVLSKANAGTPDKLLRLKKFIGKLSSKNITGRINPCICGNSEFELSTSELIEAYRSLLMFTLSNGWRWSPFTDMWNALLDKDTVVCTFRGCDIFHTPSCTVITGDGSETNCMRISSKGLYHRQLIRATTREEILIATDKVYGGCKDCCFWEACHGGCPSQALDNDWRNRTMLCDLYHNLFTLISNFQKALSITKQTKSSAKEACSTKKEKVVYPSGVEHLDGNIRHLDSNIGGK